VGKSNKAVSRLKRTCDAFGIVSAEPFFAIKCPLLCAKSDPATTARSGGSGRPDAAEVINLFGFAMRSGLTTAAIRHAIFAYPTAASDIESMLP